MNREMPLAAIQGFEEDLRKVVRRGSKSPEFEGAIEEVVDHYSDVLNELLRDGVEEGEAERLAGLRVGQVVEIASQILRSPSRIERGLQIQRRLFWVGSAAATYVVVSQMVIYFWSIHTVLAWLFVPLSYLALALAGLFSYGLHLAGRLLWKPILACFALTSGILGAIYIVDMSHPRTIDGMSYAEMTSLLQGVQPYASKARSEAYMVRVLSSPNEQLFDSRLSALEARVSANQFKFISVEPGAKGQFLLPVTRKASVDKSLPNSLMLGRTSSRRDALNAWQTVGKSYSDTVDQWSSRISGYQFLLAYKPWSLWYCLYGAFAVSACFVGAFLGIAISTSIACQIWIQRRDWFRYSRVQ